MNVRYVQLKPNPDMVLKNLPWEGRKYFYLLFTFENDFIYTDSQNRKRKTRTRVYNIKHLDIRSNPRQAVAVARKVLIKVQTDLALKTFKITDYFPSLRSITLKDFFNTYYKYRQGQVDREEISINTYRTDQDAARQLILFTKETSLLSEINSGNIHCFIEYLLTAKTKRDKKPFSRHSINIYLRHLSSAFSFAVKNQYIEINPFFEIRQLKVENIPRHLEDDEIDELRKYFKSRPLWQQHFFEFALATGLRADELFSARLDKIRTDIIHGIPAHFLRVIGKGNRPRWIPCDDVMDIIRERIELIENEIELKRYIGCLVTIPNMPKVLERIRNKKIFFEIAGYGSVSQFLLRARRACKLSDDISPHSLRHTFAIKFLEEDRGDIYTLSQILGHANVKTTEIYLSATPRLLRMRGKI